MDEHALRLPWNAPRPAPLQLVRTEAGDEALARRAANGDGAAFATLYDRYESKVYNFSYRLTGSAEDAADATQETFVAVLERLPRLEGRELNFGAYVMTAARNASYDAIARRKRATPAGDIPESAVPVLAGGDGPDRPDQEALREAHQEQIRRANESLPARQREALALRELEELSYDEVAEIMGMNRNSVAQLISRARINLRDGLRQTALGSVAATSELCDRALPLLALRQDGVLDDDASADWLSGHLVGCGTCRVRVDAMEEAGVAYRLWLPLVPALWLKTEAVARAAERVGADWSAFATAPRGRGRHLRLVAAGGSVLVIALVLGLVDRAQTPTRAPAAPVAGAPVIDAPVQAAADPVVKAAKPAERRRVRRVRKRRAAPKPAVRAVPAPAAPAAPAPLAVTDAAPAEATPAPRARRRVVKRPPANEVAAVTPVVADPPAEPAVEEPVVPEPEEPGPLCPGPNCPGGGSVTTPTCPAGSTCPPPRRPPVTCTSCGLTVVKPPPSPPPLTAVRGPK